MEKIMAFIPMYNCEKQITRVLGQFDSSVLKFIDEIVIVNNRSTDNGEKVVVDFIKKEKIETKITLLRNNNNYGLGGSHKVAFNYAMKNKYDYIIALHGDDQGNIHDILPILESEEYKKHDCMLGSRFMKGSTLGGYSKFRTFGNRVYNVFFSVALGKKISDLGSGLNMYSTKMLKNQFFHKFPDKLTFNCYMLLAANYYKHNIKFFPISWREDDQVSNVKMVSQALNTIKLVISYIKGKSKYIKSELRQNTVKEYGAEVIYDSTKKEKRNKNGK